MKRPLASLAEFSSFAQIAPITRASERVQRPLARVDFHAEGCEFIQELTWIRPEKWFGRVRGRYSTPPLPPLACRGNSMSIRKMSSGGGSEALIPAQVRMAR